MGQAVTVMNMKGGAGKATVTIQMAGVIMRMRASGSAVKILAIDYDPLNS
jgi:cellulose biosynthesis protein BcsQ